MATIKVYRNGSLSLGEHSSEVHQAWSPYDAVKPAERAGRLTSLYASPSLAGVTRWVAGNHLVNGNKPEVDLTTHEITVSNPEKVFAYSVVSYDASQRSSGVKDGGAEQYWATGIALSEWEEKASELGLDPTEWEVLLPVESIKSTKIVSDSRLVNSVSDDFRKDQLKDTLKRRKNLLRHA